MNSINISSKLYDYSVEFVTDFKEYLTAFDAASTAYVIDERVYKLYAAQFKQIRKELIYLVDAVESKKNMDTVLDIIMFWKNIGVRKNRKIICFGGGITQDLTTLASNLYLRNIDWYFFPTTLLSMCDSCIGGKCGINLGKYKNQIGVFYPPKRIIIDTAFLTTISDDDYLNGWGELLKFSLTDDVSFYEKLKAETGYIPCNRIAEYIYMGLQTKKRIIEKDEFESDLRRVLNYGHTFGHALETYTENIIPHGKAVIWGIDVANYLAWKEGLIPKDTYFDIKTLIKNVFIKTEIEITEPQALFDVIKTDKKVNGTTLNFAMLDAPAHLVVHPMQIDERLKEQFNAYLRETHEYYNN